MQGFISEAFTKFLNKFELIPRIHCLPIPIAKSEVLRNNPTLKVLYFVRHGQSSYNLKRRESFLKLNFRDMFTYDFHMGDPSLSPLGIYQAENLCSELTYLAPIMNVQSVYVSPLTRTIETAKISLKNLPNISIKCSLELTEKVLTSSDLGKDLSELKKTYPTINFNDISEREYNKFYTKFSQNLSWIRKKFNMLNTEKNESIEKRAEKFISEIKKNDNSQIILVFGHSLLFKCYTRGKKLNNCEVFTAFIDENGVRIPNSNEINLYFPNKIH